MHLTVKHALHGLNVTLVDEKLNFCDFCVEALHQYCPILPGIYHMNDTNYVPGLFWTVRLTLLLPKIILYRVYTMLKRLSTLKMEMKCFVEKLQQS